MEESVEALTSEISARLELSSLSSKAFGTKPNGRAHFSVTAQYVCKLHLPRRAAFRREKPWASDHYASTARPRCSHIEAVQIVKKLHAPRRVFRRRSCHGVDNH